MSIKALYTAHATSLGGRGGGTAKTADGALDLKIDNPTEMGGKGEGVNPEQLFAVGYSSCYLGAMKFVAGKMSPPVKLSEQSSTTAHVSFGTRDDGRESAGDRQGGGPGYRRQGACRVPLQPCHPGQHQGDDQPGLTGFRAVISHR